ncbi:MAG: MFS transporter, partial [Thermoanaerobaculia bacterium]|nr:MFS transporter [Thermoanaerobaculia bacterium]
MDEHPGRWRALALISLVELLCMSLWFGVSSVTPVLRDELGYGDAMASGLTIAVQLGFVSGTLLSAVLSLSDVMTTRKLLAISALTGALVNALFAWLPGEPAFALTLRFLTGASLAGIYPPGMKLMATW